MATLADNLIAYFKGDGNSVDAVAGTYTCVDTAITYPAGKINQGLARTSGVTSKAVFATPIPLQRTFSVSLWINMTGADQNPNNIITDPSGFGIVADPNRKVGIYTGSPGTAPVTDSILGTGTKHIVLVSNDGAARYYLGGVRDGFAAPLPFAGNWSPTRFFDATFDTTGRSAWIDEIAIYTAPLNDAGVAALFNTGTGVAFSALGTSTGDFFEPLGGGFYDRFVYNQALVGRNAVNYTIKPSKSGSAFNPGFN